MRSTARPSISCLYDRTGLLCEVRARFALDWHGIHGAAHWGRVRHHGISVGRRVGADLVVVELFAFLHDSCRRHDGRDEQHGERAAAYAQSLQGRYFSLPTRALDQLVEAITLHSEGLMHRDPTIQTCWDADRLDLGRVGITPSPRRISEAASELIDNALVWSGY